MSWSYNKSLQTPLDRVRFTIGDINVDEPLLSDEEVAAVLSAEENDELMAAYMLVQHLAMRFAWRSDVAIGDVQESLSQIARQYQSHADRLERQLNGRDMGQGVSVLGLPDTHDGNTSFTMAQFDNPVSSITDEAVQ